MIPPVDNQVMGKKAPIIFPEKHSQSTRLGFDVAFSGVEIRCRK